MYGVMSTEDPGSGSILNLDFGIKFEMLTNIFPKTLAVCHTQVCTAGQARVIYEIYADVQNMI